MILHIGKSNEHNKALVWTQTTLRFICAAKLQRYRFSGFAPGGSKTERGEV